MACSLGNYEDSLRSLKEALRIYSNIYGDSAHPDVATTLASTAQTHQDRGELTPAFVFYERAIAMYQQMFGDRHPRVAGISSVLAMAHYQAGNIDEARRQFERSVSLDSNARLEARAALFFLMQGDNNAAIVHARKAATGSDGGIIHFNANYMPFLPPSLQSLITKVVDSGIRPHGAVDIQPKILACVIIIHASLLQHNDEDARTAYEQMVQLVPVFAAAESWFLLGYMADVLHRHDTNEHYARAEEAFDRFMEE